jgi:hypothetical protein
MAHMARMAALEIRDPIAQFIPVKAHNFPVHAVTE